MHENHYRNCLTHQDGEQLLSASRYFAATVQTFADGIHLIQITNAGGFSPERPRRGRAVTASRGLPDAHSRPRTQPRTLDILWDVKLF
jgi:hypothetical protein